MSYDEVLVTVGLPVYNGEATIERALRALGHQTYEKLEIIIGDNASDDQTEKICRRFEQSEPRCTYVRSSINRGATENFSQLFRRSSGSLFMWMAADDELDPQFVESGVEYLRANPPVVLAVPRAHGFIPGRIEPVYTVEVNGLGRDVRGFRRVVRSYTRLPMTSIYGIFRSEVLRASNLMGPHVGTDVAFMQEIALRGPIETNPSQTLNYHNRDRWNTAGEDIQIFGRGKARRVPGGAAFGLMADRVSRIWSLDDGPIRRGAMVGLILALEVRRIVFKVVTLVSGRFFSVSWHRRWVVSAYWRFLHPEGDFDVHDRAVFVDRFVLPRFGGNR
jgi:glycosyltransferase involved in cell wall biosynthesis